MKLTLTKASWLAAAAWAALAPVTVAKAAQYTWTGSGTANNWFSSSLGPTLSSNWNPGSGQPLTTADDIAFNGATRSTAYQGTSNNSNAVSASVNNVNIIGSTAFVISGTGIDLNIGGNLTNSSGQLLQIANSTSTLTFNNTSTIDTGAGGITVTRSLAGSGSLTKSGAGNLQTNNANAFSGSLLVNAGGFISTGTFGGSINNNGATATIRTVVGNLQSSGALTLAGGSINNLDVTGGTADFTGSVTVGGTTTFANAVVNQTANPTFNGPVTIQSGTVGSASQFAGDFNGLLTVNGGLNNLSNAAINDNMTVTGGVTTLGGSTVTGTLSQSSGELVNVGGAGLLLTTGGSISLTDSGNSTAMSLGGTTTILGGNFASYTSGSVGLVSGGQLNMSFDLNNNQQLLSSGPMTYGGNLTLNLTQSGSADVGDNWDFFNFTSQSGELSGVTLNAVGGSAYSGLTFLSATTSANIFDQRYGAGVWLSDWTSGGQRLIFNQADGVLTVVPEPSTMVFAGIGAAMLGWQTWAGRRRKARMKLIEEHTRKLGEQRGLA